MKKLQRYGVTTLTSLILMSSVYGCIQVPDPAVIDDKSWLQNQVEKGKLTQQEMDKILQEINHAVHP